jgi:hypothetical protein
MIQKPTTRKKKPRLLLTIVTITTAVALLSFVLAGAHDKGTLGNDTIGEVATALGKVFFLPVIVFGGFGGLPIGVAIYSLIIFGVIRWHQSMCLAEVLMFTMSIERHPSIHWDQDMEVVVFALNGKRFFSTEDTEYILKSPQTFRDEGDVTLVLEWDSNSAEVDNTGPELDEPLDGRMFIVRRGDYVDLLCQQSATSRIVYATITLDEWNSAVASIS